MQWFKHDTDANQDAKLQNVMLDYGLEGYGLYWYCIELIAGKIDKNNIKFELEHDARIIARNTGSTAQKVQEMMKYFVDLGLFECSSNQITCLKLAKRLDQSMTSSPQMREIIKDLKSHDAVMIESCKIRSDKIREDKNKRIDHHEDDHCSSSAKKEEAKDTEQHAFDFWWSEFPTKISKKTARQKWAVICKKKTADEIEELTNAILNDIHRKKINKVLGFDAIHPTTYLNQERWNDEL